MAKMSFLEVVELLTDDKPKPADIKKQLDYVISRKKQLKEEESEIDATIDYLLRKLAGKEHD